MAAAGLIRSLAQIARRAVQARLADVHTWIPGQVQAYDGTKNLADVQVMVDHATFDDDGRVSGYENLGVLAGVPVGFYRAGGFYAAGNVTAGDEGILLFASSPIGEWRQTGQRSQPKDPARCSLGYPYFLPFAFNDTRTLPDVSARAAGMVIGKEGSDEQIRIQAGLVQVGASGAGAVAMDSSVAAELHKIQVTLASLSGATFGTPYTAATSVGSTLFKAK